ncbi:hypothetical protein [Pseudomonas viridiflava]|uniref:hypothetical protein n=1 Tax=Pseudomonas viridiflava TaxID=33069 RepID=UPI000F057A77|nr:hypothetical protein [Pseudomonas viridiflava]
MDYESLPSARVIEEARAYLRASLLLEQHGLNGDTALYWPAAMNSALASELYLKSFLVEADPRHPRTEYDPDGHLRLSIRLPGNRHDLLELYRAMPMDLATQFREISDRLCPGFPLEKWIMSCASLFVGTRYPYEANSTQTIDSDVLKLAPHLDLVLSEFLASGETRPHES